jgi:hypothetical protein
VKRVRANQGSALNCVDGYQEAAREPIAAVIDERLVAAATRSTRFT